MNYDEAVAKGAAIYGSVLSGNLSGISLIDFTPFNIGIEVEGGSIIKLIQKNQAIPYSKSINITTSVDN